MKEVSVVVLLGILVILNGLAVTAYFVSQKYSTYATLGFGIIACLAGVTLVVSDRLELLEFFKIGKLVTRAKEDAGAISQLRTDIQTEVEAARQEIGEVKRLAQEAGTAVQKLNEVQEVSTLILRAQADDLAAFHELEKRSKETTPVTPLVKASIDQISASVSSTLISDEIVVNWSKYGIDPSKATLAELQHIYDTKTELGHLAIVDWIANSSNIPFPDRIEYFVQLLDRETSIYAYLRMLQYLKQNSSVGDWRFYERGDKEKVKEWWVKNRNEIIARHEADMEAERKVREEEQKVQEERRRYLDGVERITNALKEKQFDSVTIRRPNFELPFDHSTFTLLSSFGFQVNGKEADLLQQIKQAKSVEELNPSFKRESTSGTGEK